LLRGGRQGRRRSARAERVIKTGGFANGAVVHALEPKCVVGQPLRIGLQGDLQHLVNPGGQRRIKAVIHPLALAPVQQHAIAAQLRQMAADFRLAVAQRAHQFAHTKLSQAGDEQGGASAGFVSQAFEDIGRSDHRGTNTYGKPNIRISIYSW